MVEETLFTALKTLFSNRFYPDVAPAGVANPYGTYQQIGGGSPTFMDNTVPSKENGYYQITAWAETRTAAKTLIKQVESALISSTAFQARPIAASIATRDQETNLYGAMQDFSIWADR